MNMITYRYIKTKIIIIFFICSICLIQFGCPNNNQVSVPAEEDFKPIKISTEDELLKNIKELPDSQVDIGLSSLVIAKGIYPDIDISAYIKILNNIIRSLKSEIGLYRNPETILNIIHNCVNPKSEYDENGAFLNNVLDKAGNCFGSTTLYLAIGERLNIPLYGMVLIAPPHTFIQYDNGVYKKDIEATDGSDFNLLKYKETLERILNQTIPKQGLLIDYRATKKEMVSKMLNWRGSIKDEKGDYVGARADYTKALEIRPDAEAYLRQGLIKGERSNYDGAIADYTKAIEINPDYVDAYYFRGFIKGEKGDYDDAIADYTKAIEITPNNASAYYNRGFTKVKKGNYDGAIADYTKTIEIRPNDAAAYYYRGVIKDKKGNYVGALADWEQAIKLNPSYKKPH